MTETEQEYFQICAWRFLHPLPKTEYGERHHIFPKSCGGFDKPFNLVRLTPEEHYRVHYLLTFIFPSGYEHEAMVYGWSFLSKRINGDFISADEYGRLRREASKIHSARMKGRPSPNKGKKGHPHTEEWKRNMSEKMKGVSKSDEMRKHLSESLKGHPPTAKKGFHFSEESKAKMRAARRAYLEKRKCQPQ